MAEKKRKRHEEGADRPAKKAAVGKAVGTVKMQFLESSQGALGPVLATTPGLNFPHNVSFQTYKKSRILPSGEVSELLLHSSQHPRLDYTAQEEKDGSSESLLQDYIGVFDPATKKLQVVPARRLAVRQALRSELDELRAEKERIAAAKTTMTAKRHALATEFGSKKSKKAINQMAENAIVRGQGQGAGAGNAPKDEALASAVLDGMASKTSAMPTKADVAAAIDDSKPRPTANRNAEHPGDVYSVDSIVGKDVLISIPVKDWVTASEAGQPVKVHSQYVAKRIMKLVRAKEIQKLKVLRFMLLCINFNSALKQRGKGAKVIPPKDKLMAEMGENAPAPVVDAIRRRFASEQNDMTRWHVDNLITHICAAALIVDGFEVDVNDLREDLKLENKEIKQYFHEIGCRLNPPTEAERNKLKITKAEAGNHTMARLKLPLNFPKVKTGPSKRR
ncbi:RNA polymerase I associated factor, A49-like protein [Sporormia fimetaria CBS 119925]|uniref:RNA polymerase I associated factor, A49-like protein n=1 Tax=Sporormia fimetaria CBS 119925 TaxID=1340428 RepID=A0A6A6VHL0_9PLEO|nr:RNA polymerase I associated factor, A49-like protein [Sporormia fimetaria CBS 119925]